MLKTIPTLAIGGVDTAESEPKAYVPLLHVLPLENRADVIRRVKFAEIPRGERHALANAQSRIRCEAVGGHQVMSHGDAHGLHGVTRAIIVRANVGVVKVCHFSTHEAFFA